MNRLLHWLPALFWAATIFVLSSQSSLPQVGPDIPYLDKIQHASVYALLGLCIVHPLCRVHRLSLPVAVLLGLSLASAYGASDEWHQRFVPNRSCDVWDWTADTVGAAVAITAYCLHESRRRQQTHR